LAIATLQCRITDKAIAMTPQINNGTGVMMDFIAMVELLKRTALALFLSTLLTAVVLLPLMLLALR
jgi:hypothetical protein